MWVLCGFVQGGFCFLRAEHQVVPVGLVPWVVWSSFGDKLTGPSITPVLSPRGRPYMVSSSVSGMLGSGLAPSRTTLEWD